MAGSEQNFYSEVLRRITWFILALGIAGAVAASWLKGVRTGFGFLIGAALSYLSFWRWQQVINSLGANPRPRSTWSLALRLLVLVALAYGIIRLLGLNPAAAVAGLLVSAAAVILEILYELIYAGT